MQLTVDLHSVQLLIVLSAKGLEQVMPNAKIHFYENCRRSFLRKLLTA